MEDSGVMQDLFIDDLDCIFDDDGPSDELTLETDEALDFDEEETATRPISVAATTNNSNPLLPMPSSVSSMTNGDLKKAEHGDSAKDTASAKNNGIASTSGGITTLDQNPPPPLQRSASEPSKTSTSKGTTRRAGKNIEGKGNPLPPPTWHSDAADRPHRQAMVIEIARLLQTRKRTVPSSDWLRQLPHKARKLEERLYRNSSSLEAYLDKATLKTRLKKLAKVITKQFEEARRQQRGFARSRSSESSVSTASSSLASFASSAAASMRDSFTSVNSIDSLRSLRESIAKGGALTNTAAAAAASSSPNSTSRNAYERKSSRFAIDPSNALQVLPEVPFSASSSSQNSLGECSAGHTGSSATQQQQQQSQQQKIQQPLQPQPNPIMNAVNADNLAEIERQRSVNAQLQQQIMENIRQQEELVRRMQGGGRHGGQPAGAPSHIPGNQPLAMPPALGGTGGNFGPMNVAGGGVGTFMTAGGNQQFAGMNHLGNSMALSSNLQMNPTLMAAMLNNRLNSMGGPFPPTAPNAGGMVPNPLIANMGNRNNMLQQAYVHASSQGMTNGVSQPHQQQFAFLQGAPMMPGPNIMGGASNKSGGASTNYSPVLPNNSTTLPAPLSSSSSGATMPPPDVPQRNVTPQLSLQDTSPRVAKTGFMDDSEPLSPGSFNW